MEYGLTTFDVNFTQKSIQISAVIPFEVKANSILNIHNAFYWWHCSTSFCNWKCGLWGQWRRHHQQDVATYFAGFTSATCNGTMAQNCDAYHFSLFHKDVRRPALFVAASRNSLAVRQWRLPCGLCDESLTLFSSKLPFWLLVSDKIPNSMVHVLDSLSGTDTQAMFVFIRLGCR